MIIHANAQELVAGKDGNIRSADMRAMVISADSVYLATRNEVYRAIGPGEKWESVYAVPAGENDIRCAAGRCDDIFLGTRRGLIATRDAGATWRSVFRTIIPEKGDVLSADVSKYDRNSIAIGTQRGVFASFDGGASWKDLGGALKNRRVTGIVYGKGLILAAGDDGVFARREEGEDWERIYVSNAAEDKPAGEDSAAVETEEEALGRCVAMKDARIYIGGGRKISYSDDGGKSWSALPSGGISGNITCLLAAKDGGALYCGTTKGVYRYSPEKAVWSELYKGPEKSLNIRSLVPDRDTEGVIWAVTSKGLYRFEGSRFIVPDIVDVEKAPASFAVIPDDGPPFQELARAAMDFNEVGPEKISRWRAEARLRALVPKISIGMDTNTSNSYEIYTSATKDYVVGGPDDISKGVDVSVSWELGDMIWSDDQTNIDVRSKLNTQLRNDIMDDLRRAYYERKRLQCELLISPPKDPKSRYEKELRIEELGQVMDDLTGNYFSNSISLSNPPVEGTRVGTPPLKRPHKVSQGASTSAQ